MPRFRWSVPQPPPVDEEKRRTTNRNQVWTVVTWPAESGGVTACSYSTLRLAAIEAVWTWHQTK